jgi:hypothetical protein
VATPGYDAPGAHGEKVPSSAPGPGMKAFMQHLLREYPGSTSLGCFANRSVRGGKTTSLHAVARAFDWKYATRQQAEAVMEMLTGEDGRAATLLGVQAIHDYHVRDRQRRARAWGHGRGWHFASVGPGDLWLHLELTVEASRDDNLLHRINANPPRREPKHEEPPAELDDDHDDHLEADTTPPTTNLKRGSSGHDVVRLQHILRGWHIAKPDTIPDPGACDGRFGDRTAASLACLQESVLGVNPDGAFGAQSRAALKRVGDYLAALGR